VTIAGIQGTLYEGETFQLGLRFDDQYPMEPPEERFPIWR
jgi:ubiquitin-protein ligase